MYLGTVVEEGPAGALFANPRHPYTEALLAAIPLAGPVAERAKSVAPLEGDLPSPLHPPKGCPFVTRCPISESRCHAKRPLARPVEEAAHRVACFFR